MLAARTIGWLLIASSIALLEPIGTAEATPRSSSITCRVPRGRGWWKLKSVTMSRWSSVGCRSAVAVTRWTLRAMTPSWRRLRRYPRLDFHLRLEDVSTREKVRFEARAWVVTARGHHLRHLVRTTVAVDAPTRGRYRTASRMARMALNRAVRDLVAEIRHRPLALGPLAFR